MGGSEWRHTTSVLAWGHWAGQPMAGGGEHDVQNLGTVLL
jgi:hypothetical protein